MARSGGMKPCICGASRCDSAASTDGENFSGLLSCAMIIVTSARISLFVSPRARRRSSVPCTASRRSRPIASMVSGVRLFADGLRGMPAPCRKARSSTCSCGPAGATLCGWRRRRRAGALGGSGSRSARGIGGIAGAGGLTAASGLACGGVNGVKSSEPLSGTVGGGGAGLAELENISSGSTTPPEAGDDPSAGLPSGESGAREVGSARRLETEEIVDARLLPADSQERIVGREFRNERGGAGAQRARPAARAAD